MMFAFTLVTTFSWAYGGADWGTGKLRWLTTLVTLCYQPFAAYYIARRVPFDRPALLRLILGITIVGVYLGFTGIFEHFPRLNRYVVPGYIMDSRVGVQFGRARGPFAASVANGGALIFCFLVATSYWASQIGKKKLLTLLFAMGPMALTVYFTDTRGVWVGFGMVLVVLAVTQTRMRPFGRFIVIFALVVYVSGVFSKFSMWEVSLFSRRTETVDYRWANFATNYKMFQKHPVLGIGYGNFVKMWREYFVTDDSGETRDLTDGNNTTFLCILGEEGLVGFVPYFAIFVCAGIICWKGYFRLRDPAWEFERRLVIVAAGTLLAFLLMGITTDVRYHVFYNSALFMILGIVSSLNAGDALPSESQHESPRATFRPIKTNS
jgi:O-antigen ligase